MSIFFFDFFAFALLFRYFKSSIIDIIPFLSQESDNRFFTRFLPGINLTIAVRSKERKGRERNIDAPIERGNVQFRRS